MKKLSKRTLSFVLAAIMVITSIPFFAVSTSAADSLDTAMTTFESYISRLSLYGVSGIKTNTAPAYKAYIKATNLDSDATQSERDAVATELNEKLADMEDYVTYTGKQQVTMGSGSVQPDEAYYENVVWADSTDYPSSQTERARAQYTFGPYNCTAYSRVYYPNTVLLYDGINDSRFPVMLGVSNDELNYKIRIEGLICLTTGASLKDDWYGSNSEADMTDEMEWNNYTNSCISKNPNTNEEATRMVTDDSKSSKFMNLRNSIQFVAPSNWTNPDSSTTTFYEMPKIDWIENWSTQVAGLYVEGKNTNFSTSVNHVYVINYKMLTDAINTAMYNNKAAGYLNKNNERFKAGDLGDIFEAFDNCTSLDPASYDYATDSREAAIECSEDIKQYSNQLINAVPDGSSGQYDALDVQVKRFESMMNNIKNTKAVYSNIDAAYTAYIVARQCELAYNYGIKDAVSYTIDGVEYSYTDDRPTAEQLEAAKTALKNACDNMVEMTNTYNAINTQCFISDDQTEEKCSDYNNSFKNLIYVSRASYRGPDKVSDDSKKARENLTKGMLYLNDGDYSTTWLHMPQAVGVYDGGAETGEDNTIRVPAILGFTAIGTSLWNDEYFLYRYYSNTPELQFSGNWQTPVDSSGNKWYYEEGTYSGTGDKFYTGPSLNKALNNNMHTDAVGGSSELCGLVSQKRETHKAATCDHENYFTNTINIAYPATQLASRTGDEHYYYLYNDISCTQVSSYSSNNDYPTVAEADARTQTGSFSTTNGDKCYHTGDPAFYVIDYSKVRAIIDANKTLLTDGGFKIQDYVQGGLHEYLQAIDKLTACDPRNPKYDFSVSDDEFAVNGTTVQTNAHDINMALTETEDVLDEEASTLDTVVKVDNIVNDDGALTELANKIDSSIAKYPEIECFNTDVWSKYQVALLEARKKIAAVVASGYDASGYATGYAQYTEEELNELKNTITQSEAMLNNINSHHLYKFGYEESGKMGHFNCDRNHSHDEGLADMSTYDALKIVYSTLDKTKFTEDGKSYLEKGKSLFDEVLATDLDEMSVSGMTIREKREAAIEAILSGEGERPDPAQELVDNGIRELLSEITEAEQTEVVDNYSIKLNVVKVENGDCTTVAPNIDVTPAGGYGTVASVDASAYTDGADVSSWRIQNGSIDQTFNNGSNALSVYVQGGTTTVTAYYTPAKTESNYSLAINSVFGTPLYNITVSEDTVITTKSGDINTLVIGENGKEYNVPNTSSYKLEGWKVNGKAVSNLDATAKELADSEGNIKLDAITSRTISESYDITLDGTKLAEGVGYDYHYRGMQKADGASFIAIIENGVYKPVSYADEYEFFANGLLHNFYNVTKKSDGYYAGDTKLNYNDEQLFFLDNKLPMVSSTAEKVSDTNYTVRSQISMGTNATITEWGTLYSLSNVSDEKFNIEGVDDSTLGLYKAVGTKKVDESNQFAQPFVLTTPVPIYTRTYVKFKYTFNGRQYDAVTYSDINICFNN